jgi:hypothetical protein
MKKETFFGIKPFGLLRVFSSLKEYSIISRALHPFQLADPIIYIKKNILIMKRTIEL